MTGAHHSTPLRPNDRAETVSAAVSERGTPTPEPRYRQPRRAAILSDVAVRKAAPRPRPYKLADGRGLYLYVTPAGGKIWRFDYTIAGKRKTLSFGAYADVPLVTARAALQAAREQVAAGRDPLEIRRQRELAARGEATFGSLYHEWAGKRRVSDQVQARDATLIVRFALPTLRTRPVGRLTAYEVLRVVQAIEARGIAYTAVRVRQLIGQVLRYGVATARVERDVTVDLRGSVTLAPPDSYAAVTDPLEIGGLVRAIDDYRGTDTVRTMLQLAPYVFVRPGNLRRILKSEIDVTEALWRIPGKRMKMRDDFLVPLSRQALAIVVAQLARHPHSDYLFPSLRTARRPTSENTLNAALRRMGYGSDEMTAHGFRAMASTRLNEMGFDADVIERQLAHRERSSSRRPYNRAEYLPERRAMMQAWADEIDRLRAARPATP